MLRIYYYCVQVAFVKLSAKLHSGPSHDFSTKNSLLIDPVDTKPEKFENCVFTTKPHQMFTALHWRHLKVHNHYVIFEL